MSLVEIVKQDIKEYLDKKSGELLFNERDLQMHLALHLIRTRHYDDVDVEYYVPSAELGKDEDFPWRNGSKRQEVRMDILVRKGDEFLPIELKYKTKRHSKPIKRFNEEMSSKVEVLKNQGAQDLGMYDFWKDVRRIELVRNRFAAVKNGLAVFVTNDQQYRNGCKSTSNNYQLRMTADNTSTSRHWQQPDSTCARTHPDFDLDHSYTVGWHDAQYEEVPFHYCIVEI